MEPNKELIRYCLLFCFHQKKSANAHRIICMVKNIIFIKMNANWFKNDDFDIGDKERSRRPAAVEEEDELRKDGKKSWKLLRLIYTVSIFLL